MVIVILAQVYDVRDQLGMKSGLKLGLLISIALVVMLGIALSATSKSGFCQLCHEMKSDYKSWKTSTHSNFECVSCHIEPGAVNFLRHKLSASEEVTKHFTRDYKTPINGKSELSVKMPSETCLRCHSEPGKERTSSVLFDHKPHKDAGFTCAYCHNRIAHAATTGYEKRVNMKFCLNCHKEKKAPVKCSTCHPKNFNLKPESHSNKAVWIKSHGKGNQSECSSCHYNQKNFCNSCHGLQMPHPPGWNKTHVKERPSQAKCAKCHTSKEPCESCHHQGYDPAGENWVKVHPRTVRDKGIARCLTCHDAGKCSSCHSTQN